MTNSPNYINRLASGKTIDLFQYFPVVVVSGARQVGKSTLLEHSFPKIKKIVFDPVLDLENAKADPELFLKNHPTPLILDEIQYVPELINCIKRRVDADRSNGQYLITGSQQWEVMKHLAESLAGRAVFVDLDGFSLLEKAEKKLTAKYFWQQYLDHPSDFTLPKQQQKLNLDLFNMIWRGSLPDAHFLPERHIPDFFMSYLRTYVERDVRLMMDISDVQLFSRFYRLCAALSAREINYSELGRELGVNPQTSKKWQEILRASFQWIELVPFTRNTVKRVSKHSKGYFMDTGLMAWSLGIAKQELLLSHPNWGFLFETFVVMEIKKILKYIYPNIMMYHWRSHGGAEVDLILEHNGWYYPIEIKAKSQVNHYDVSGIQQFRKTYPKLKIAKGLVLCASENPYAITKSDFAIPWNYYG